MILVAMPPWGMVVKIDKELSDVVHSSDLCADDAVCAIHKPSHHMREWPIVLRLDYGWPLVERTCPHGVGHPDPDSIAWYERGGKEFYDSHGCDGCCRLPAWYYSP